MAKIFISYNRQSEQIVKNLANDIESLGHSVWFDQELSGGQSWWEQILSTIRDCAVFVFVLSPEGLNSTACKREYTYAAELGKPVLPVLVADGVSMNLLPPTLSKIEYVDYRKQDREAAFRLARAFGTVPPATALPDPLPKPPEAPISYLGGLTEQVDSPSILSYQEQSVLLVELKRSMRDPESAGDARTLLKKLKKRRDLLAVISEDIDELLVKTDKPLRKKEPVSEPEPKSTPPPPPPPADKASADFAANPVRPLFASNTYDSEPVSNEADVEEYSDADSANELSGKGRLKGAALGALAGLVCGIAFIVTSGHLPLLLIIGGTVAGTVAGMNAPRIFAGAVGMTLVVVSAFVWGFGFRFASPDLLGLFLPTLCVLVAKFMSRN